MHPLRAYIHRFAPLTDTEWEPLAAVLTTRHVARKDYFIMQGAQASELALVVSGASRLFYTRPDGEEKPRTSSSKII